MGKMVFKLQRKLLCCHHLTLHLDYPFNAYALYLCIFLSRLKKDQKKISLRR